MGKIAHAAKLLQIHGCQACVHLQPGLCRSLKSGSSALYKFLTGDVWFARSGVVSSWWRCLREELLTQSHDRSTPP